MVQGLEGVPVTLAPNTRVRCFVPAGEDASVLQDLGVEIVRGDLRDAEAVQSLFQDAEGALVLHLAGIIHRCKVAEFDEINFEGAEWVLTASQATHVARLVVMSSIALWRNPDAAGPVHRGKRL